MKPVLCRLINSNDTHTDIVYAITQFYLSTQYHECAVSLHCKSALQQVLRRVATTNLCCCTYNR